MGCMFIFVSEMTTAAKINTNPIPDCGVTVSCKKRIEKITPKTPSSDIITAACDAGVYFCPIL